ncbi:ABC transporter permease [Clostridium sp. D2Q-11]|uniref:ABC transporter permease n=1 Tax=Anaeromonas frigoriresistens TaxID=2683708 RepID=A0A942Z9B8_9FIRM|nr:ABC transporter permease [Anaeromonas frigoriresistens]MBS4538959.1 ABC transporter permease [Anaeromonas frigoriresistens]
MTFSSIVRKNFIYNFNKYISFYFVNSLIVAMLFMYGSLIFNSTIVNNIGKSSLYDTVIVSLGGTILFSIIFITYTNVSFLKNRGKEFGVYLTLGMTAKDLTKLIFIENIGIMIAALITGILGGTLFGRLFYMGLNKILGGTTILYEINYESILLSIGVFTLISLGNFLFNMIFIRKVSVIDVIKVHRKKEVGKARMLIGAISLMILIVSTYYLPKALFKEIFKEQSYIIGVFIGLIIVCPYMVIGSFISIVKYVLSKFPKLYNNNIMILSNLSHRFLAYKNVLYMLSLLVAGAMFFVGFSYSLYTTAREDINADNPYDIMFVENSKYNRVEKEEISNIIDENNGRIEKYNVLEYLEVPVFRDEGDELTLGSSRGTVISEENYNQHMNTNIDVDSKAALFLMVPDETKMIFEYPTSILININEKQLEKVKYITSKNNFEISKKDFKDIAGDATSLYLDKSMIKEKDGVKFTNYLGTRVYSSGRALVLDNEDYEVLKESLSDASLKKLHLMNVKNSDKAFEALLSYLKKANGLDDSYWNETDIFSIPFEDERGTIESYRPVYKEELIKLQLDRRGVALFTLTFIGLLFVIANGVVLYYKVLSDADNEKERLVALTRIGVSEKEIKTMISKELAITFFIPILIGGGMGLYFLYVIFSNSEVIELFMRKAFMILIWGSMFQILFYIISRKKYIKEVM